VWRITLLSKKKGEDVIEGSITIKGAMVSVSTEHPNQKKKKKVLKIASVDGVFFFPFRMKAHGKIG